MKQMEKVRAGRTTRPTHTGWHPGTKAARRSLCTGSASKMDAAQAHQKARAKKAEALGMRA
jgi:hypothetical protein